ncbi:uncharacterized protein LOC134812131 [Bolinopsis microptera]|uniref:uncharacterized protein LOC134812131 n=1 Tax=Bolinopsis microptera TaxID=2820187 RepID=UPI003078AAB1
MRADDDYEELMPWQDYKTATPICVLAVLLFLSGITIGLTTLCAFDLYKDFALKLPTYNHSDIFLNNFGVALPIIGALGRLAWGIAGDLLPVWMLLVIGDGMAAFLQVMMYVTRPTREVYVVVCGLLAISTGMTNMMPPVIKRVMGPENMALNFGFVFGGEAIGCVWYVIFISLVGGIPDAVVVWIVSIPALVALTAAVLLVGRY